MKALEMTENNPMSAGQIKYKEQRDLLLWRLRKELKLTYQELQNYLEEYDFTMNFTQIRNICVKYGDKVEEKNKKAGETPKNTPKEPEIDLLDTLEEENDDSD